MRKLFALAALLAGTALAQNVPVQLISPTGSTAGQAVVSTGPSSAPAWSNVTASGLTPVGANTVYGNFTGASVSPSANAVPSCSTANSALKYTTSAGLSCGTTFALTSGNLSQFASTTSAQLLGVLSDETGTGSAVFATSPSLTTPTVAGATLSGTFAGAHTYSGAVAFTSTITPSQTSGIVGTTTNNNVNAGSVGEYVTATGTGVSLTSGASTTVTNISLTAGDWDVSGSGIFVNPGTTTITSASIGIGTTIATLPAAPLYQQVNNQGTGNSVALVAPEQRLSLGSTTTVYLTVSPVFSVSTLTGTATIRARRVR